MARAIAVEIVGDSASVERAFARSSTAAKSFDHSLGKSVRGAAAGTGVFRGLGRSIAFASGTFLGFAAVSDVIKGAITGAENLAKAQTSLNVAVKQTHGNFGKLIPQYTAVAKGAEQFGINQADATTALARATVLTGDAAKAQRAYQEALVISKATGKDFNAVLTATAKGQEGITTSLKRYGIEIAKGASGTQQFDVVMSRFAGQAAANTNAADRLQAVWQNTEETIGTALLPVLDKYLTELGNWLEKMQQSGRLQHDVNAVLHDGASVFHKIGVAVKGVDEVTGSFVKTLELLAAFKLASLASGWIGSLSRLAAEWGVVARAAKGATAAEAVAAGGAGVAGGAAAGGAATGSVVSRIGAYTGAGAAAGAVARGAGALALPTGIGAIPLATFAGIQDTISTTSKVVNGWMFYSFDGGKHWARGQYVGFSAAITPQLRNFARTGNLVPGAFQAPGFGSGNRKGGQAPSGQAQSGGPFGAAQPIPIYKSFSLTIPEQITQAQASLTKTNADDVAAAKQVIARIKRLMSQGRLAGNSLLQALQAEGAAFATLQSAQAAAAQKAAAAAQKAQAAFQNRLDPLGLEVQLSKAEAFGKSTVPALKALLSAAKRALASANSLAEEKAALDQITQLNQALKSAQTTAVAAFQVPAKLALALAKDSALGKDSTSDLLKLKAAILKFIKTHKHNLAALTGAYNQLAAVNQQLGSSASSALANFKQLNTAKIAKDLGLTGAQAKALRATLSQVGPGGTVPGGGVGAFGQIIGPDGHPRKPKHPKAPKTNSRTPSAVGGGGAVVINDNITIPIYLDGKVIARATTKHQQKQRRRNSHQRRGPNAGD